MNSLLFSEEGREYDDEEIFPPILERELDRCRDDPNARATQECERVLREWSRTFSEAPVVAGGFLEVLEELRIPAKSTDPLVKDPQYNVAVLGHPDVSRDRTDEFLNTLDQCHKGHVRLLRYGELIERAKTTPGIYPSDKCTLQEPKTSLTENLDPERYFSIAPTDLEHDHDLLVPQIERLAQGFVQEFYMYANHNKLYNGIAQKHSGVELVDNHHDIQFMKFEVTESSIVGQFDELQYLYRSMQTALMPHINAPHRKLMTKHVRTLLSTLWEIRSPTSSSSCVLAAAAEMLQEACDADPVVADALLDSKIVDLWVYSAEQSKVAQNNPSRVKVMGEWWHSYEAWGRVLTNTLRCCIEENGAQQYKPFATKNQKATNREKKVSKFFLDHVEDPLIKRINSECTAERLVALEVLASALLSLPPDTGLRISQKLQEIPPCCVQCQGRPESSRRQDIGSNRSGSCSRSPGQSVSSRNVD